jgi:hypothetical protein
MPMIHGQKQSAIPTHPNSRNNGIPCYKIFGLFYFSAHFGGRMAEQIIMKSPGVEITTKIAKFGTISYQVANIGSVSVYTARKINPVAAIMVLIGVCAGLYGNNLRTQGADGNDKAARRNNRRLT